MNLNSNINFIYKIIKKYKKTNKSKIIKTRFPPEPNGYLHLGHAKSIVLNFELAKEFKGHCNLRFDDTNPSKENKKFVDSIKKDIKWLGFIWNDNIKYSSDYFEIFYKYAVILIKKKLAYVDLLDKKKIKEYRGTLINSGKNSPYREQSIEKNIFLFNEMKNGKIQEGKACLRAKINMSSPYIILRDPVLYRISFVPHYRTNTRWYIYPMYDFAHCIADSIEGITHSICTLEFQDNRKLYNWILKNIKKSKNFPKQYEFSRLNLEYSTLSKRKIKKLIEMKVVLKWNDPQLHTISGLRNRGYTANSIRIFCKKLGVTKQESLIQMSLLESCIRDDLNKSSPRRIAIINPLKIVITNFPDNYIEILKVPNYPQDKKKGYRNFFFSKNIYIEKKDFSEINEKNIKILTIGKKIKLRYAYLIKIEKIKKDKKNKITCLFCKYYPNTLGLKIKKKSIGIIHWLSESNFITAQFKLYQYLFLEKNVEKIKDIHLYINKKSFKLKNGIVESIVENEKLINRYQFEREGYFLKKIQDKQKNKFIFHRIVKLKERNLTKLDKKNRNH